jgi:predicted Fe-S protein YdhL (DUF1289 family)
MSNAVPLAQHALLRRRLYQIKALPDNEILPSPCVSVCTMSTDQGWCLGCYRTLDEIATWASLKPQQQREVWRRVEERLAG